MLQWELGFVPCTGDKVSIIYIFYISKKIIFKYSNSTIGTANMLSKVLKKCRRIN